LSWVLLLGFALHIGILIIHVSGFSRNKEKTDFKFHDTHSQSSILSNGLWKMLTLPHLAYMSINEEPTTT
jgi:hypothetical protein